MKIHMYKICKNFLIGISLFFGFFLYVGAVVELPSNFKPQCFRFYDRIESFSLKAGEIYKLDSNKPGFVLVQSGAIIPYKSLSYNEKVFEFVPPFEDLTDNNPQTFLELDSAEKKEFQFVLGKKTIPHEFLFLYDFDLKYHKFEFFISNDGINYERVSGESIHDFSFQYFKVIFIPLNPEAEIREAIKIRELSFRSNRRQYIFKAQYDNVLEVYHSYDCISDFSFDTILREDLVTSIDTPILYTTLKANPKYNTYTLQDRDNDWIEDSVDNCPYHYNPDQLDNNSDGVGNVCSDTDGDGIIGYKDICPYIYNPKQYDINANGIGDACEFDRDKDRIYDSVDNCINVVNPDQLDTDNDGIGDICDNCKYYNPTQADTDENGVGDVCDKKYELMEKNDKDKDGILDWGDNCPDISNPDQADQDRDRVGDKCDNCMNIQNTDQTDLNFNTVGDICEDSDNDGFVGYLDNCMYVTNPKQIDSDNNGIGNMCEDVDRDTKIYVEDNCPYISNIDQSDIDNDGVGDVCDGIDNRFIESNKEIFALVLLFFVVVFGYGIFVLYKRL